MIIVDSNVIIDVLDRDEHWHRWSIDQIAECGADDRLVVTPVMIAEVGPRYPTVDDFIDDLASLSIGVEALSNSAAFAAGTAFRRYRTRRRDVDVKSIIADFLIGGQAEVSGAKLLTRDPRFYRNYFPSVALISPSKDAND